jgi:hypothetical protein
MLEKLIWISAFMLVGACHGGCTVGEVESQVGQASCQLLRVCLLRPVASCPAFGSTFEGQLNVIDGCTGIGVPSHG